MGSGQLDFIVEIENALSAEQCESLIARFESDPHKEPGKIAKGYDPNVKRTMDLTIPLEGAVLESLGYAVKRYKRRFPGLPDTEAIGLMLMRYMPEDFYSWHNDAAGLVTMGRQFVALWYLNTVEVGGHTEFGYYGRKIKPEQGKLILFPAGWTHFHRGAPPISGPKYIATTWLSLRGSHERQIRRDSAVPNDGVQAPHAAVCGPVEEGGKSVPYPDRQGT